MDTGEIIYKTDVPIQRKSQTIGYRMEPDELYFFLLIVHLYGPQGEKSSQALNLNEIN